MVNEEKRGKCREKIFNLSVCQAEEKNGKGIEPFHSSCATKVSTGIVNNLLLSFVT